MIENTDFGFKSKRVVKLNLIIVHNLKIHPFIKHVECCETTLSKWRYSTNPFLPNPQWNIPVSKQSWLKTFFQDSYLECPEIL